MGIFDPNQHRGPAFSLDQAPKQRIQEPRGKERRRLFTGLLFLITIGGLIYSFWGVKPDTTLPDLDPVTKAQQLQPMKPILMAKAPPLPSAATISEQAETVQQLLASKQVPAMIDDVDPVTLGWVEAQLAKDVESPPIPQHVNAEELVHKSVRIGLPVWITGRLDDSLQAPIEGREKGYQRLLVAMESGQSVEVLAPPEAVAAIIGRDVQVTGRYAGLTDLPTESGSQVLPLIIARNAATVEPATATSRAPGLGNLEEYHSGWKGMPDDLYADVNDEYPILETRPYYFTLGQAKLDMSTPGVYDQAKDANVIADQLHLEPKKFRGQAFHVSGFVYSSWEDTQVAQDRPFEVTRVLRILAWKRDWGPFTMTDIEGKERTSNKWVLRLFEFAVIGDQPLPQKGAPIEITGRFVKFRAIPVDISRGRNEQYANSRNDKVYTVLFATSHYDIKVLPGSYDWTTVRIVVLVFGVLFALFVVWLIWRDNHEARSLGAAARLERRKQIHQQRLAGKPAAVAASSAPVPAPAAPAKPEGPPPAA